MIHKLTEGKMLASEQNAKGSDKIERYGWKVRDEKGNLEWLPKNNLHIDKAYQRNLSEEKRLRIASNFSWIAFGALSVALRPDGTFWIIDGSYRHAAAMSRSDIKDVPCVLFSTVGDGVDEANGFLALNTARKPLEYLDKFNALLHAGDPHALRAQSLIIHAGYKPSKGSGGDNGRVIRCLSTLVDGLKNNADATERVWPIVVKLSEGGSIHVRILASLIWLDSRMQEGERISSPHNAKKLLKVGQEKIIRATGDACSLYQAGGVTVWAKAVLEVLNKGKRNRLFIKTGHGADDTDE